MTTRLDTVQPLTRAGCFQLGLKLSSFVVRNTRRVLPQNFLGSPPENVLRGGIPRADRSVSIEQRDGHGRRFDKTFERAIARAQRPLMEHLAFGTLTLTKEPWDVPQHYPLGADELVPLRAGERIAWRIAAGKAAPR